MFWLFTIISILAILTLAYQRAPFWIWAGVSIVAALISGLSNIGFPITPWLVLLGVMTFLNIKVLRKQVISRFGMFYTNKQMPPISETEQAAIDAGDVWWEAKLFRGMPDWKELKSFENAELTDEEQAFLDNQAETLCKKIDTWKQQKDYTLQQEVWDYIVKERFFCMLIPKRYGGLEFSPLAQSTIVSKIATRDNSTAVTVMVPNSLGPAELLLRYGTDDQKNYYLPRLGDSTEIPCFGLTGPEAGSDAGSMPDYGTICYGEHEGETVLGIKLNFNKRYITLAPVATLVGLAFKCYDPDKLLGDKYELGITLALIDAKRDDVTIGPRNYPIGSAFPNGVVRGKDVFVPLSAVIGGVERIGQGWRMLMECLSEGRGISLPALSAGTCKVSYRSTSAYASVRKQFRTPIVRFEGVEESLAQIGGYTYIVEAMRVMTASAIQSGIKPAVVSAIAKYNMTELARKSINNAMDIHGGRAVMLGPSNYLANCYAMMPVAITVEGANILTRNLIIFGQGAIRCHPYLLDEIKFAQAQDLDGFDDVLFKHLSYTASNGFRTLIQGVTGGLGIMYVPKGPYRQYYKQLSRMSTALAFISDKTMMYLGGSLKRKEYLSARLGDVLSHLYMASCVLKYAESSKQAFAEEEAHVRWALEYCLYQIQYAFEQFFNNFPSTLMGYLLKKTVFPWGRSYKLPNDKRSHELVQSMISDNPVRDKITENMYIGDDKAPIGAVETAMVEEEKTKKRMNRVCKMMKEKGVRKTLSLKECIQSAHDLDIISADEFEELSAYAEHYSKAIAVDDFDTPAVQ